MVRKQRKLGNYPTFYVLFSTTLALFVLGLLGLFMLHTRRLTLMIRENVKIQIYLARDITDMAKKQLYTQLSHQPFVLRKEGKPQITFIPKEEAAKRFMNATGEQFMQVLEENPLCDAYVVSIAPVYQTAGKLASIKHQLESSPHVFEVGYVENLVTSINKNLSKIGSILVMFACLLLVTVSILIHNALKLSLHAQRFLVRSMQLVGAFPGFIRKPFLLEAAFIGLVAGLIASLSLIGLLYYINLQRAALATLQAPQEVFAVLGGIILLGISISVAGTYQALNRYLGMSMEELY